MRWYEYKLEVDDLHASDDLKAKLLAMQPEEEPAAAIVPQEKKKALRFPARRVLPLAACVCVCILGAGVLFRNTGWIRMGAAESAASSSAMMRSYAAADYSLNSLNVVAAEDSLYDSGVGSSSDGVALTEEAVHETEIIYTANLTLKTEDYDSAREALTAAVTAAGGYIESSDESSYESSRSLSLTVRVPQENYSDFLAAAAEAGDLTNRSEQAEDVTTQYMDIEARLKNLEAQRARLEELQAGAENLSDLLDIESQLSDVQYQLESWQSQLNWYADQVACSTVYIYLDEVKDYTPVAASFGERIAAAFRDGWTNFVSGAQQAVVWLVALWPVAILVAAVAIVAVLVYRARRKKRG